MRVLTRLAAVLVGRHDAQGDAQPLAEFPQLRHTKGAPAAHGEIGPHPQLAHAQPLVEEPHELLAAGGGHRPVEPQHHDEIQSQVAQQLVALLLREVLGACRATRRGVGIKVSAAQALSTPPAPPLRRRC